MSGFEDVFDYYVRNRTINPIHPHCGPFNEVSDTPSNNEIDEICRQHDIAYGKYQEEGVDPYFSYVPADEDFLNAMDGIPWWSPDKPFARAYGSFFKLKRALAMNDFGILEEYKSYRPWTREDSPKGSTRGPVNLKRPRHQLPRPAPSYYRGNPVYPVAKTRLLWGKRRRRYRSFRKRRYAKKAY